MLPLTGANSSLIISNAALGSLRNAGRTTHSVPGWKRFLLIFDLDGTLIDSAPDLRAAVNEMLRERGRAPLTVGADTRQ